MAGSGIQANTIEQHLSNQVFRWQYLGPRYWLLWLWFAVLWLVTRLPYCVIRLVGRTVGLLLFYLVKSRRRIALINLTLCFPDWSAQQRWQVARESFAGAGLTLFESGLVWWSSKRRFERFFSVENVELLASLADRPVLFFGLHNTCVEMVYAHLAHLRPIHVLFRVNNNPLWEYMATRSRLRHQVTLVPRKQVPEFLSRLRAGEACLIAADQDLGRKRSLFVPFFGVATATVPSLHGFARQTGASVVFADAFRRGKDGYVLRLQQLNNFPTADAEADTALMNRIIEDAVRQHPDQYLWMHQRFKTRPGGQASLYKPAKKNASV